MVQRGRSHPSVFIWSFCNEVGCNNESAAAAFRAVAKLHDPTRAVTQNHLGRGTHPLSVASLDVQGFSHKSGNDFDVFHATNPTVPEMASECCSCLSQRGVDVDDCPRPRPAGCKGETCGDWCGGTSGASASDGTFYNNEIGACTASQVARSDGRAFVAGTFIWSGFDYLGESRGYPQTVKCRGVVLDAAGFRKESAWWVQSLWLSAIPLTDAGRPPLPDARTVHIVEAWRPAKPVDGSPVPANRSIHVYSDAPYVQLLLNGKPAGTPADRAAPTTPTSALTPGQPTPAGEYGITAFTVPFSPGNLTAVAMSGSGFSHLASHSLFTPGAVASLRLSLDAPSASTGTGLAVVADGEDVALVRAELLDGSGNLATGSNAEIRFSVVSGEGRLWGTHSGNPADTAGPLAPSKAAYHGLLRAVVRSSTDRATSDAHRRRLLEIDLDGGHPDAVRAAPPAAGSRAVGGAPEALPPIVLRAEVKGVGSATLHIPLTADLSQRAVAVAGGPQAAAIQPEAF